MADTIICRVSVIYVFLPSGTEFALQHGILIYFLYMDYEGGNNMLEKIYELVYVTGVTYFILIVSLIIMIGYLLGRITIKGVSLGTAGVFIVALIVGALFKDNIVNITISTKGDFLSGFKTIEALGLVFFVTSVGFIAGPNFFSNMKRYFKSYFLLGVIVIAFGALSCVACYYIGIGSEPDHDYFVSMLVGILSGALTSTPAFSASKASVVDAFAANDAVKAAGLEDAVTVGHGIAYLFGVIGVVLFVQLIPKLLHANMEEEVKKISVPSDKKSKAKKERKTFTIDSYGLFVFGITSVIGIFVGAIRIPLTSNGFDGTCFALTTTGGALLVSLIFGHFGHIGPISLKVNTKILEVFRELGLMLFLIGAGVPGGVSFVQNFKPIYFLYGVIMTIVPMVVGFIFAKFVMKLPLLNNLGAITGGMTSTPALGTLINTCKSTDVASAYAATYPIALITVVIASQILILTL